MGGRLNPLEAAFLEWEDHSSSDHMHFGWTMVFNPQPGKQPPNIEDLRAHISRQLKTLTRFTMKLAPSRAKGLIRRSWQLDQSFDVALHVTAIRARQPGGEAELVDCLDSFYSRRLSRDRPLWELGHITGLERNRWALAIKVHHSLLDGAGGRVATELLVDSPSGHLGRSEHTGNAFPRGSWPGRPRPSEILAGIAALGRMLVSGRGNRAPKTSLNVPVGPARHLAFVEVSLDQLRWTRTRLGGTVNDVLLAACAGGLRQFFLRRGEAPLVDHIDVMVPVNPKGSEEDVVELVSVSAFHIDLPLAELDPLARYRRIVLSSAAAKERKHASHLQQLLKLARFLPPAVAGWLEPALFPRDSHSLTITNVPGPSETMHMMGSPVCKILPVMAASSGKAVGFGALSYTGTMIIGLIADPFVVPDLDALRRDVEDSLEELRRLADEVTDGSQDSGNPPRPPVPPTK
jgi:diacylglycerol O-acyltransferase / wax synthase